MKTRNKISVLLLFFGIFVFIILMATFFVVDHTGSNKKTIGFIMTGSMEEEGWNGMHYKGVASACDNLDVNLIVKENIREFTGETGPAIEDLIHQGATMIILSSYGYAQETEEVIAKYPDVAFYINSFDTHRDNVTSYFSRMYQARYLAGIVAGMQTETDKIGYVAAMSNSEVNRGISAFTLGVKRVNPDAVVVVSWTNDWDNEVNERRQADKLISDVGVDVITYHQNQPYVIEEAEKAGIYSIGYHQVPNECSDKCLTSVVGDWTLTYEAIISQYLQGKNSSVKTYWVGLEKDAVKLTEYSNLVPEDTKEEVLNAKKELLSGKDVFSGVIYDNNGVMRCNENETISDEVLLEQFDWLVEGVEVYEK